MQLNNLKPNTKRKSKKRVGRGGKRGSFSGKGIKGQKSRSGHRIRPQLRDVLKKIPKRRGSGKHSRQINLSKRNLAVVNLSALEGKFPSGSIVSPALLAENNLIRRISGRIPEVKILGEGKLTKIFHVKNCLASKSAREAIIRAGGKIEEMS